MRLRTRIQKAAPHHRPTVLLFPITIIRRQLQPASSESRTYATVNYPPHSPSHAAGNIPGPHRFGGNGAAGPKPKVPKHNRQQYPIFRPQSMPMGSNTGWLKEYRRDSGIEPTMDQWKLLSKKSDLYRIPLSRKEFDDIVSGADVVAMPNWSAEALNKKRKDFERTREIEGVDKKPYVLTITGTEEYHAELDSSMDPALTLEKDYTNDDISYEALFEAIITLDPSYIAKAFRSPNFARLRLQYLHNLVKIGFEEGKLGVNKDGNIIVGEKLFRARLLASGMDIGFLQFYDVDMTTREISFNFDAANEASAKHDEEYLESLPEQIRARVARHERTPANGSRPRDDRMLRVSDTTEAQHRLAQQIWSVIDKKPQIGDLETLVTPDAEIEILSEVAMPPPQTQPTDTQSPSTAPSNVLDGSSDTGTATEKASELMNVDEFTATRSVGVETSDAPPYPAAIDESLGEQELGENLVTRAEPDISTAGQALTSSVLTPEGSELQGPIEPLTARVEDVGSDQAAGGVESTVHDVEAVVEVLAAPSTAELGSQEPLPSEKEAVGGPGGVIETSKAAAPEVTSESSTPSTELPQGKATSIDDSLRAKVLQVGGHELVQQSESSLSPTSEPRGIPRDPLADMTGVVAPISAKVATPGAPHERVPPQVKATAIASKPLVDKPVAKAAVPSPAPAPIDDGYEYLRQSMMASQPDKPKENVDAKSKDQEYDGEFEEEYEDYDDYQPPRRPF